MEIRTLKNLSQQIRNRRKSLSLTQAECAAFCGVGTRFLSELENGKESIHLGKTLHVLKMLGLKLQLTENGAK
jgi:transcriptional regulator, y4mF family